MKRIIKKITEDSTLQLSLILFVVIYFLSRKNAFFYYLFIISIIYIIYSIISTNFNTKLEKISYTALSIFDTMYFS